MTPEEEQQLLRDIASQLSGSVGRAIERMIELIRAGVPTADAVQQAMDEFTDDFRAVFGAAMAQITGGAIAGDVLAYEIGGITLSQRLYANAQTTSAVVEGIVNKHVRGFQSARSLALELYEGYGFNPVEPLVISPDHGAIPKYMREALLGDAATRDELARAYARAQSKALRTGALRAAYTELLKAIDDVEKGAGADYLDKKLWVATEEKMRYYATRIARTELHRAYAARDAIEIMGDDGVRYVQWIMTPNHPAPDICDYFAGVDLYGLGRGVYPKASAPVAPAHPHCRCVLHRRTDIRVSEPQEIDDAEARFFSKYSQSEAGRIAGSQAKLERIKGGESAWDVHNAGVDPLYHVRTVEQISQQFVG